MFKNAFLLLLLLLRLIINYHSSLILQLILWSLAGCLLTEFNSRDSKDVKKKKHLCNVLYIQKEFCFRRNQKVYNFATSLISGRVRADSFLVLTTSAVFQVAVLFQLKYNQWSKVYGRNLCIKHLCCCCCSFISFQVCFLTCTAFNTVFSFLRAA